MLLDPEMRSFIKTADRPSEVVDWSPDLPYKPALLLRASSWPYKPLFDTPAVDVCSTAEGITWAPHAPGEHPGNHWGYRNVILPKGEPLSTFQGTKRGQVWFDGDIVIPALFRGLPRKVWMSTTPMEAFTLRPGVRKAKGRVVVGGLGLGWQLRALAQKKTVKEIWVHERERDLCDWYGHRLVSEISEEAGKPIHLICGDAYKADFEACDAVIFDIWPSYREARYDKGWQTLKKEIARRGLVAWGWGDVV